MTTSRQNDWANIRVRLPIALNDEELQRLYEDLSPEIERKLVVILCGRIAEMEKQIDAKPPLVLPHSLQRVSPHPFGTTDDRRHRDGWEDCLAQVAALNSTSSGEAG
ncbi:hypothetical protein [Cupriavidus basilensis]|uniref:hypothetical protein n=1 Tax=Cupriavidus basilensis TaxID=68895 RepID=UPI0020A68941|nr:hypothetical protein [Cupriavidus basilensis]MCP3017440.1 hypothetical protein [Cupriavidus basilensis]